MDQLAASQAFIPMRGYPINRFDNIIERDLFERTGKSISAACSSFGFYKPAANEILNDFLQKFFRDVVQCGQLIYRAVFLWLLPRKINDCAYSVVDPPGNLHQTQALLLFTPLSVVNSQLTGHYLHQQIVASLVRPSEASSA
jgi:hypothetical protein